MILFLYNRRHNILYFEYLSIVVGLGACTRGDMCDEFQGRGQGDHPYGLFLKRNCMEMF